MVLDHDAHQDLGRRGLRVDDVHRPVPVVVERACVEQLELGILQAALVVDESVVRERRLWVVVAPAQQGMARQSFEVPPVLLDILAVVALRPGEAEHALLEDPVLAVPEGEGEAELMPDVGDPGHPVLVPAIGPGAGVVVREGVPGIPALGIILTDGAPGALAQVRAPLVPRVRGEEVVLGTTGGLSQPCVLRRRGALTRLRHRCSACRGFDLRCQRCQVEKVPGPRTERDVEPVAEVVTAPLVPLAGGSVVELPDPSPQVIPGQRDVA